MEIPILDSILHDNLKPWLIDNLNTKQFSSVISKANQINGNTYEKLHEQVITLLDNYKHISKKINKPYSKQQSKTVSNFYKIENPSYTDTITQFYFLIITKETERIFNSFSIESKRWIDPIDIYYHTTQTLLGIRVLASEVNEEMKERNFNNNTPLNHIDYTLLLLKNTLIALFFDIQEVFKGHLNNIETIDTFCINYLGKIDTNIKLEPTEELIRFNLNKIINKIYDDSELNKLLKLSEFLKSENKNQLVAAIENYKFFIKIDVSINSIDELLDTEIITKYFEEYKAEVLEKINTHNLGHQRLMLINQELEKIENHSIKNDNKYSIISKINNWLEQQKAIYLQNPSAIFSTEIEAQSISENRKSPLPQKDKETFVEQKKLAYEYLKFLNGFNRNNEKILSDSDFSRLINFTNYLIETGLVPEEIKIIPQANIGSDYIRYTFYTIHKALYGTQKINVNWISFLKAVFLQFKNSEWQTLKTKFSTKPILYDADLKALKK